MNVRDISSANPDGKLKHNLKNFSWPGDGKRAGSFSRLLNLILYEDRTILVI